MALYFVGDIQGCLDELLILLEQVKFDPGSDQLWLTGDLVARGPRSLDTLRFIRSLKDSAKTVLGNHDLHLIATYKGIKRVKSKDLLDDLLAAEDADELIAWLTQQPLLRTVDNVVLSHAGISPQWTIAQAIQLAKEAEAVLKGNQCDQYLANMYHSEPSMWSDDLEGFARFRYIVNSLTRMRFCFADGRLEFEHKQAPDDIINNSTDNGGLIGTEKNGLTPWYDLNHTDRSAYRLVFGHWASLMGNTGQPNVIALDTGCVWGNQMTMWRLDDGKYFTTIASC